MLHVYEMSNRDRWSGALGMLHVHGVSGCGHVACLWDRDRWPGFDQALGGSAILLSPSASPLAAVLPSGQHRAGDRPFRRAACRRRNRFYQSRASRPPPLSHLFRAASAMFRAAAPSGQGRVPGLPPCRGQREVLTRGEPRTSPPSCLRTRARAQSAPYRCCAGA